MNTTTKLGITAAAVMLAYLASSSSDADDVDDDIFTISDPNLQNFIAQLHPSVQQKFIDLIQAIQARGYRVIGYSSFRSFGKQNQMYQTGQTPAPAGTSYHNYGMAFDINIIAPNGTRYNMASGRNAWLATGIPQLAESMGFVWGGRFGVGRPGSYYYAKGDSVHFQYSNGFTHQQLLAKAITQYGNPMNNNNCCNRVNL